MKQDQQTGEISAGLVKWTPRPEGTPSELYEALKSAVLDAVPDQENEWVAYGGAIAKDLGIPRDVCLSILRDLRNNGQVILCVACDQDTGAPKGSGYVKAFPKAR